MARTRVHAPNPTAIVLILGLLAASVAISALLGPEPAAAARDHARGEQGDADRPGKRAGKAGKASKAGKGSKRAGKAGKAGKRAGKAGKRRSRAHKQRRRTQRRAFRRARLGGNKAVWRAREVAPPPSTDLIDAGFEQGLNNWNTAGVGEVTPTVSTGVVRSGAWSGHFQLSGTEDRTELILGGNGGGSADHSIRFFEGDDYWYGFSFYISSMTYGEPGAHNLIMQLKGTDEGSPYFGLQLWDYEGDDGESGGRGLWSHGDGMDGDRFLSPVAEQQWHDVLIHFRTSSAGNGLYEVYLDGRLIDSASGVSVVPGSAEYAYIKSGLYRNGDEIPGTSELYLDSVKLSRTASLAVAG